VEALRLWSDENRDELDSLPEEVADDLRGMYGARRSELKMAEA
jgi:hypothetical protein